MGYHAYKALIKSVAIGSSIVLMLVTAVHYINGCSHAPAAADSAVSKGIRPVLSGSSSGSTYSYEKSLLQGKITRSALGPSRNGHTISPQRLVSIALKAALAVVKEAHALARNCSSTWQKAGVGRATWGKDRAQLAGLLGRQAVEDCMELMDSATDQLNAAAANLSAVDTSNASARREAVLNLKVWLSASLSYQSACSEGFTFVSKRAADTCDKAILSHQEQVSKVIVHSLDLVDKLLSSHHHDHSTATTREHTGSQHRRRMLHHLPGINESSFPAWLYPSHRTLLGSTVAIAPSPSPSSANTNNVIFADLTVAQDGSGDYLTINDALVNVPPNLNAASRRFIIYIKRGVYDEIVTVPKNLANLTFVGDGMGATIITGSNNVGSGLYNTLRTATVGVSANGFMARDITFQNTAGPSGYQAVAMRASADYVVFYRCGFEGYQDTLYALSSRQFYKECKIYGTVDFIFGNAVAIFQGCELVARRPLEGQQNTITAQGRKVEVDITGFSFQNCSVVAGAELQRAGFHVESYLGRPWKAYSRTVFLQSFLEGLVHPAGWLAWNASNPFTDTLYYGEYQNRGPGSRTDQRVPWAGVHPNMTLADASPFTADNFIFGSTWLPLMQVDYASGLT